MTPSDTFLAASPMLAPALLGASISGRGVTVTITEVEAYTGPDDPGSHGFRGMTRRNRALFGSPGTLYAYRSYGTHTCLNVVSAPDGVSSAVLLRAGIVTDGIDVARARRGTQITDVQLARGPGNLGAALGAALTDDDGTSLLDGSGPYTLTLPAHPSSRSISQGPRTGVAGTAGGASYPWRFWLHGEPTVSAYRRHGTAHD